MTSTFSPRSAAIASFASGLSVSATAITPARTPSSPTSMAVLPSPSRRVISASAASVRMPSRANRRRLPSSPRTLPPPPPPSPFQGEGKGGGATFPRIPCPGIASKFSTFGSSSSRCFAARTIASPSGCSEPASTAAASRRISASPTFADGTTSVTFGSPRVSVPVLSNTTVLSFCARSSTSPPRIRMPASAPLPTPTMSAAGVATPSAHGQEMMSTAMKASSPCGKLPAAHQPKKARKATATTAGTKYAVTLSARRCTAAVLACASSTILMIWDSAVSAPTRVVLKRNRPVRLIVPPITALPAAFSTGMDSPVSMDSSTEELPSSTTPSVGIFSPGRTTTVSSTITDSAGTSISAPPRMTWAAGGPTARSSGPAPPPGLLHHPGLGGHLHLGALPDAVGEGGPEVQELAHRRRGALLDDLLHVFAQQHEGDDDGGNLEVDVALLDLDRQHLGEEQHRDAVDVGHRGAHRDQKIHVDRARTDRLPRTLIEAPAADELHRRHQNEQPHAPGEPQQRRDRRPGDDGGAGGQRQKRPGTQDGEHQHAGERDRAPGAHGLEFLLGRLEGALAAGRAEVINTPGAFALEGLGLLDHHAADRVLGHVGGLGLRRGRGMGMRVARGIGTSPCGMALAHRP